MIEDKIIMIIHRNVLK